MFKGIRQKLFIIPSLMVVDYFMDHRLIGLLAPKKPMRYKCP